jgi:hypothetical protein
MYDSSVCFCFVLLGWWGLTLKGDSGVRVGDDDGDDIFLLGFTSLPS